MNEKLDTSGEVVASRIDPELYKKSFALFLQRTNEKEVVLDFLAKHVDLDSVRDVLDIGAGSGALAGPLSDMGKTVTAIEPNPELQKILANRGVAILPVSWQEAVVKQPFDLIIAAYVVTHFPHGEIGNLIDKMYRSMTPGGKLMILTIDPHMGSWREIHTYFYDMAGIKKTSSSVHVENYLGNYPHSRHKLTTEVRTRSVEEMLDVLAFDFHRYEPSFTSLRPQLLEYLKKHTSNGECVLHMAHDAYIITK